MKIKDMGITKKEQRKKQLRQVRNKLIRRLGRDFSYGEIAQIIRIDKGGAYRICVHGANRDM